MSINILSVYKILIKNKRFSIDPIKGTPIFFYKHLVRAERHRANVFNVTVYYYWSISFDSLDAFISNIRFCMEQLEKQKLENNSYYGNDKYIYFTSI